MKILFTTLFLLTICGFTYSQSSDEVMKNFFEAYKLKDTDKAVDILFGNGLDANEVRGRIKLQLRRQMRNNGEYFGADLVTTKTAGPNVVMYTYTVRHMLAPVVFRIMLYKPNDQWQVESFNIYSNLAIELEEQSRGYAIREKSTSDSNGLDKTN